MKVMIGTELNEVVENYDGFVDVMLVHWPSVPGAQPWEEINEPRRNKFYNSL